jgi:hypothetical protein
MRCYGLDGGVYCQTEYGDEDNEDDDVEETSLRFPVLSLTQIHKPFSMFHRCYLSRRLSSFASRWKVSAMHTKVPSSTLPWLHPARYGQAALRYYFLRSFLTYQFKTTKWLQQATYPGLLPSWRSSTLWVHEISDLDRTKWIPDRLPAVWTKTTINHTT